MKISYIGGNCTNFPYQRAIEGQTGRTGIDTSGDRQGRVVENFVLVWSWKWDELGAQTKFNQVKILVKAV